MKIIFLGTGVAIPNRRRGSPGLIVRIDGEDLLFDCGPGILDRLTKLGIDVSRLKHIFITHFHVDHVLDLIALVKARAFLGRKKLKVHGPVGLKKFCEDLFEKVRAFSYLSKDLKCFEFLELRECVEGVVEETKNWRVSCTPVLHFNGIAYRIDSHGKSVVYSGDTSSDENIVKLSKNADVLIHECSFPDEESLSGLHTIPSKLAGIAREANVKKLILNHLYPLCEGREREMKERIGEKFSGKIIIAEDFMEVDL